MMSDGPTNTFSEQCKLQTDRNKMELYRVALFGKFCRVQFERFQIDHVTSQKLFQIVSHFYGE